MGTRIAQAGLIIQTLRDAGYKNTSYAVAELVDNSIEAGGKNIHITIESGEERLQSGAISERIQKIGIFDDGEGMNLEVLSKCLSFGWGTRLGKGTGLGKFGFGLKGSSISQAKRIEIYSWQNNSKPNFIYLDVDEVIENDAQDLPEAKAKDIPGNLRHLLKNSDSESGTLIIWTKLDRLNPKRAETLVNHLNGDMCRIFRHYMDNNEELGDKRNISVGIVDTKGNNIQPEVFLKANDPSYLLTPNNLPGYENVATNVINEQGEISITDEHGKKHSVEIICTVAKPEIQSLGGNSEQGRHYGRNNGISFVRHGRELELSYKGFYTQSEPRNRWIGLEIRFPPSLDKYFNVPNNKQSVRDFKNFDEEE
ncbi:ATP-binding protein, partial [Paracoccaceae bacterium]|nr:ATP-binding protein [Paracoccaceae bacterium]